MQRSISLGGKGVHAPRGGKGGRKGIKRDRSGVPAARRRSTARRGGGIPFDARYGQLPTAQISPEDLAAYLDARRRNWPSNTVVERKMRESEACLRRLMRCLATPAEPRPRPRPWTRAPGARAAATPRSLAKQGAPIAGAAASRKPTIRGRGRSLALQRCWRSARCTPTRMRRRLPSRIQAALMRPGPTPTRWPFSASKGRSGCQRASCAAFLRAGGVGTATRARINTASLRWQA